MVRELSCPEKSPFRTFRDRWSENAVFRALQNRFRLQKCNKVFHAFLTIRGGNNILQAQEDSIFANVEDENLRFEVLTSTDRRIERARVSKRAGAS
jgi:hypothetical protein